RRRFEVLRRLWAGSALRRLRLSGGAGGAEVRVAHDGRRRALPLARLRRRVVTNRGAQALRRSHGKPARGGGGRGAVPVRIVQELIGEDVREELVALEQALDRLALLGREALANHVADLARADDEARVHQEGLERQAHVL